MTVSTHGVTERVRCRPSIAAALASDAELLDRFITRRDEAAFAELVRRHASMVLGVCRRVLHNAHDAEDCFQAAFLVLVRKAETIWPREMVGNWLYGVAYRTALEARKLAARRRIMERRKPAPMPVDQNEATEWAELGPLLDQELSLLPDKYRAVLIACDLEGKTREETARELGIPEGTVASRLARARALLARRMARYSFSMTTTGLAAMLVAHAVEPAPETLVSATIAAGVRLAGGHSTAGHVSRNVASLTETVARGFLLAKLKLAGTALTIVLMLGLALSSLQPSVQADRAARVEEPLPRAEKAAPEPKKFVGEKVKGSISSIDAVKKTIMLEGIADAIRIADDAPVLIEGKKGSLAELKKGTPVTLQFAPAGARDTAIAITVPRQAAALAP